MEITKKYRAEYAHIVRGAYSERCRYNVHGHSGLFEITLQSEELDSAGMVVDFGNLKPIKQLIDLFDHTMLLWEGENEEVKDFFKNNFERVIIMKQNTTAENMARVIADYAEEIVTTNFDDVNIKSVTVHETATGRATKYAYETDAYKDSFTFISKGCYKDTPDLVNELVFKGVLE